VAVAVEVRLCQREFWLIHNVNDSHLSEMELKFLLDEKSLRELQALEGI